MEALESELTCPVCLELYCTPLLLPCLHNLCQRCAEEILLSAKKKVKRSSEAERTIPQVTVTAAEADESIEDVDNDSLEPDGEEEEVDGSEDETQEGATNTEAETANATTEEQNVTTSSTHTSEDESGSTNSAEGPSTASSPETETVDNGTDNKTPTAEDKALTTNLAQAQAIIKAALKADDNDEGIPEEEPSENVDDTNLDDEGSDEEESFDDATKPTKFPCPTCRKDVEFETGRGLESLRRNITLENIIERYRDLAKGTKPTPITCDVCDADPPPKATKTCTTCEASYCDNCLKTTHPSNKKAFARHKLVEPHLFKRKVLTCPDHEDEKLNMFCCVDEMPICALCKLVGKHSEHKVAALAQMYREKKEAVATSVSRLERELKELGDFVTKVKQTITELEVNSDNLKSQLTSSIEELCGNLQNRRDAMLKEVEQEKDVQLELLQGELATHEEQVKRMDALMMYAKEAMKEEDHASFLQSVREVDGRIGQSLSAVPERATQASILFDSFLLNLEDIRQQVSTLGFLTAPGPVEILREACNATSGKAILHWQPKTKGVVDSYTITCLMKSLSWTEEIAKVTCPQPYQIFTDLRPSTKYIFQICANNKCGPSPAETVELFTKPPLPLVLQLGDFTSSTFQIKWFDYNLGDLKIIYYLLSYRLAVRSTYKVQTNEDWEEISNIMGLEYTIDGLHSRSRYDIKVTALYQAGTSVTSEVFTYWTGY